MLTRGKRHAHHWTLDYVLLNLWSKVVTMDIIYCSRKVDPRIADARYIQFIIFLLMF
jgi:hypothetical protein